MNYYYTIDGAVTTERPYPANQPVEPGDPRIIGASESVTQPPTIIVTAWSCEPIRAPTESPDGKPWLFITRVSKDGEMSTHALATNLDDALSAHSSAAAEHNCTEPMTANLRGPQ